MKSIYLPLLFLGLVVYGCKKTHPDLGTSIQVPEAYVFMRNGNTSVDRQGQIIRQAMLTEIGNTMKSGAQGMVFSSQGLKDMFNNSASPFLAASLNASNVSLSSKTSASEYHVLEQGATINRFKRILDSSVYALGHIAGIGQAGVVTNAQGNRQYLVNGKGLEYVQLFQKGLMGACFMDQIVNHYLSDEKLNVENDMLISGKNYTMMEHHWDEAFGYFSIVDTFILDPSVTQARGYWGNYFMELETEFGLASTTYEAFRKGRAAIVAHDYITRDEQVDIIVEQFEKVSALKSIGYLNKAKASILSGEIATGFHQLSEGVGFIFSLRYARNPRIDDTKSEEMISILTSNNGFYGSDLSNRIDSVTSQIAIRMGFDPSMSNGTF